MNKYLILFFGSNDEGPYVNVMAHTVDNCGVDNVIFIDLVDSPLNLKFKFVDFFGENLPKVLKDLADGKYNNQQLQLPKNFKTYKSIQNLFQLSHRYQIEYDKLEMGLSNINKEKSSIDSSSIEFIIDVTSVPKRIALEIILACQNIGLKEVQLFELKNQVRGESALYHNLEDGKDYEYVNFSNLRKIMSNQTPGDQNILTRISTVLTVFSVSVGLNLILLFEFISYLIPWRWLIQHPNSYAIQGFSDLLIITLVLGIFQPAWRKVWWSTGGVLVVIVALISMLGGPK